MNKLPTSTSTMKTPRKSTMKKLRNYCINSAGESIADKKEKPTLIQSNFKQNLIAFNKTEPKSTQITITEAIHGKNDSNNGGICEFRVKLLILQKLIDAKPDIANTIDSEIKARLNLITNNNSENLKTLIETDHYNNTIKMNYVKLISHVDNIINELNLHKTNIMFTKYTDPKTNSIKWIYNSNESSCTDLADIMNTYLFNYSNREDGKPQFNIFIHISLSYPYGKNKPGHSIFLSIKAESQSNDKFTLNYKDPNEPYEVQITGDEESAKKMFNYIAKYESKNLLNTQTSNSLSIYDNVCFDIYSSHEFKINDEATPTTNENSSNYEEHNYIYNDEEYNYNDEEYNYNI
jgi:hypothetical protein